MPDACDTLRITTGRAGPVVTSSRSLERHELSSIDALARELVMDGEEGAAAGFPLADGRRVVLRRSRATAEVRGILVPGPLGRNELDQLLGDHPFWARPDFVQGRPTKAGAVCAGGSLPDRWCIRVRRALPGFCLLEGASPRPAAPRAPVPDATVRLRGPGSQVGPEVGSTVGAAAPAGRPRATWPLAVCSACTAASVLFLVGAIVARRQHEQAPPRWQAPIAPNPVVERQP